jgi:arylsulfatase A-like enzyme
VPGEVDPKGGVVCLTPPRPMLLCTSSDGTEKNQVCTDEGPLTLKRSETVDEELSAKVVDYLDRNDPKKTNKPFFVWYNPARMHVTTTLSEKYMNMVGVKGGKDWGVNEAGMKQLDDNIGIVFAKLEAMGQMDNTIIVFTTDNGAETMTFPDGGITPFKGQKGDSWEGGYRVPMLIRWPGHIKAGVTTHEMMAALDWMPTLAQLAGGPTGDGLKKQIEAGKYPGFVKTTLDGVNQADFLCGGSEQSRSARDFFFYYSGAQIAAVRWKNWKFVYYGTGQGATGWLMPLIPYHWTMLINLKRDPFEQAMNDKTAMELGGAYNSTVTAYIYDWNILPIGQKLALDHLETYIAFPPLQAPASYNLSQVMEEINAQKRMHSTKATAVTD